MTLDCVKLTEPHQVILVFIAYQVGSKETAQSEPELARERIWVLMKKVFVAGVKVRYYPNRLKMLFQTLDKVLMQLMTLVNRELHHTAFCSQLSFSALPHWDLTWVPFAYSALGMAIRLHRLGYAHGAPLSKSYCSWDLENLNGPLSQLLMHLLH